MKKEIILTPEELYFMGTQLQAKYIDYAYVAAMGDIQQRRGIYESESIMNLAQKGLLMEDFSGDVEIMPLARQILEPVFFGELESSIEIASVLTSGKKVIQQKRFHFYEDRITAVTMQEDGVHLELADEAQLKEWITSILPKGYYANEVEVPAEALDMKWVSRILAVKSNRVGQRAAVEIYLEFAGVIFQERQAGTARSLTKEKFVLEVLRGIKGE